MFFIGRTFLLITTLMDPVNTYHLDANCQSPCIAVKKFFLSPPLTFLLLGSDSLGDNV